MIAWVLDDRGTGARFVQDSDKKGEAFAWNDAPNLPQGVFDMKATVPEGDLIWLFDKHKYQGPQTSNAYTLRVLWNNQVWETPHGPVHSTDWRTKDPVIINR
jgi:hypothetical protein